MTTVQSANATLPTATASSAASPGDNGAADASTQQVTDRFLTLLVSQLKNQDPLNPLDNAQVTSQLAQLSTVNGINKLNDTMTALAASLGANQFLQSSSLVGHDVLVPGAKLQLVDGKAQGGFNLATAADKVVISISDAAGHAVRQLDLGAQDPGAHTFAWDGQTDAGAKAVAGTYTISINATVDGKTSAADPLAIGHVDGVVPGSSGNGPQVQLGALGRVNLADVLEIN